MALTFTLGSVQFFVPTGTEANAFQLSVANQLQAALVSALVNPYLRRGSKPPIAVLPAVSAWLAVNTLRLAVVMAFFCLQSASSSASCFRHKTEHDPSIDEIRLLFKARCLPNVASNIESFLVVPSDIKAKSPPSFVMYSISVPRLGCQGFAPGHSFVPGFTFSRCDARIREELAAARSIVFDTSHAFPDSYVNVPETTWCTQALHVVLDNYSRTYNKIAFAMLPINSPYTCLTAD